MVQQNDFPATFDTLKEIMATYESDLVVDKDEPRDYSLTATPSETYPKGLWFGGAQIKKSYVSYHLMPVYVFADLLEGMSDELKKRMQGKSCFNLKRVNSPLFGELAALTKAGFERYRAEDYA